MKRNHKKMSIRRKIKRTLHKYEYQAAVLFSVFLISIPFASIVTAYMASGPMVLGTEMNGDGSVEYLCLGRGCERTPF